MNASWVVDASVVVKWFLPESGTAEATNVLRQIRRGDARAVVPELLLAETANVVWKRVMQGSIAAADAATIVEAIIESPFHVERTAPLLPTALAIAMETHCTVYDAIYVALAVQVDGVLLTADQKLARLMSGSPYADRIRVLAGAPN